MKISLLKRLLLKLSSPTKAAKIYKKLGLDLGDGCSVGHHVSFGSEPYLIKIGNHVRITEDVRFITHDGGVWVVRELYEKFRNIDIIKPIKVGNNVHIGIGSVIMPGVLVGNNVIIGCGSIVTHDIEDNSIVAGVPAKKISTIDTYIEKHQFEFLSTKSLAAREKRKFLEQRIKF